jgi:hypothetical protein
VRREERRLAAVDLELAQAGLEALAAPLSDLNEWCDRLARAALVAAGYRQHNRGEWRKRRGHSTNP